MQFRILSSERNASSRSVPALTRSYYEARLVMRQFFGIRDPAEFAAIFLPQDPTPRVELSGTLWQMERKGDTDIAGAK